MEMTIIFFTFYTLLPVQKILLANNITKHFHTKTDKQGGFDFC